MSDGQWVCYIGDTLVIDVGSGGTSPVRSPPIHHNDTTLLPLPFYFRREHSVLDVNDDDENPPPP